MLIFTQQQKIFNVIKRVFDTLKSQRYTADIFHELLDPNTEGLSIKSSSDTQTDNRRVSH